MAGYQAVCSHSPYTDKIPALPSTASISYHIPHHHTVDEVHTICVCGLRDGWRGYSGIWALIKCSEDKRKVSILF